MINHEDNNQDTRNRQVDAERQSIVPRRPSIAPIVVAVVIAYVVGLLVGGGMVWWVRVS